MKTILTVCLVLVIGATAVLLSAAPGRAGGTESSESSKSCYTAVRGDGSGYAPGTQYGCRARDVNEQSDSSGTSITTEDYCIAQRGDGSGHAPGEKYPCKKMRSGR